MAGEIVDEGFDIADLEALNPRMLDLLLRFLAVYLTSNDSQQHGLSGLTEIHHGPNALLIGRRVGHRSTGQRKADPCDAGRLPPNARRVEVILWKQREVGFLPVEGGYWLELLVGHALRRAGVQDLRISMKLGWPQKEMARRVNRSRDPLTGRTVKAVYHTYIRDELDVVARLDANFLAVSCKVGKTTKERAAMREVESVARRLGRFTIPILVQPKVDSALVEESIEAKGGAVRLGIQEIADPARLRGILDRVFAARRRSVGALS